MKLFQKLFDERYAKAGAALMRLACYFAMLIFVLCLALSLMGRQAFRLHTSTGTYEGAIYAEEDHTPHSRNLVVYTSDDIYVWADANDQIDLTVQAGLSLIFAANVVPLLFAFWYLSRVFANISKGQIFTEQNASYLLYYGLLQCLVAVFIPFLKLFICYLVNLFSECRIDIATGKEMLSGLIPSIAFIVAAYILHYGIHLQDEVDHTL